MSRRFLAGVLALLAVFFVVLRPLPVAAHGNGSGAIDRFGDQHCEHITANARATAHVDGVRAPRHAPPSSHLEFSNGALVSRVELIRASFGSRLTLSRALDARSRSQARALLMVFLN
jgi:hypothetical protein